MLRFGILGSTQVDGATPAALRGLRLRGLLALLLLDAGRVVAPERIIDGLYGQDPPHNAANALQSQVSRLRQALPGAGEQLVEHHPGGYRLAVGPEEVDAHLFERLTASGRAALRGGDAHQAVGILRGALELWRGAALGDVAGLPFAAAQAARLEELRLTATEEHARAVLDSGLDDDPLPGLQRAVADHPLREPARGLLMRLLHARGRHAEALAQFDEIRRLLAEELGADPSPELADAHLRVLRGEAETPREPRRPAPVPLRGLPHQLTSFIGREEEMLRAEKQLASRRLVTVTGPGGAGKTRMALELAARHSSEAAFVDLSGLTDGADIPRALLGALDLREAGLTPSTGSAADVDRLAIALARRDMLLVLDNCEHVIDEAAAHAARLLSAVPGLRVLATSREPLGVTGEVLIRLSGLPLPAARSAGDGSLEAAAVRLFADRAADAMPDFGLDEHNADTVLRICRRLDGLPLAIELAAARLRSQELDDIADRLDDRFTLLSRGSRTALPRHQTLRAVVEWSWELLSEPERTLGRRLTVFSGGWNRAAAVAVSRAPEQQTLDLLDSLTEKSLVEVAGGRYRMLETVRAFCAERLSEAGEDEAARHAHAAHFLALAESADEHLRRSEQLAWLRALDTDLENLNAALNRSITGGDLPTALRMFAGLSFYWWLRGMRREAADFAERIMAELPDDAFDGRASEPLMCALTASLSGTDGSHLARLSGNVARYYHAAAEGAEAPRWPFLHYLAAVAIGPSVVEDSRHKHHWSEFARLFTRDPWLEAMWCVGSGFAPLFAGDLDQARAGFSEARDRFRVLGDRWGVMIALNGFTDTASRQGDLAAALAAASEALTLAEELGSLIDTADLLRMRGSIALRSGEVAMAEVELNRAVEVAQQAGAPEYTAAARLALGGIALGRGRTRAARALAEQARAECPVGWYLAEEVRADIDRLLDEIARAERA